MKLPLLKDLNVIGKTVLLRADLDSDFSGDNLRMKILFQILEYLLERKANIVIIGHKGRPEGREIKNLSLKPLTERLSDVLKKDVSFLSYCDLKEFLAKDFYEIKNEILLVENLRFWKEEEENDAIFARSLVKSADLFVNEAFAVSHREHASICGVAGLLPHAAGLRFTDEVSSISKVLINPARPVLFLISGVKKDKLKFVGQFERVADKVLIGGRLPEYLSDRVTEKKLVIARLSDDKKDITSDSAERFENEIKDAGTIVLSGPLGKFENENSALGTKRVFFAVAKSKAFKISGGGDTQKAISLFGLDDKFDWISVGGGAMLEFLGKGTLPGIQVLLN